MNKSKQELAGLCILLPMLAGYVLWPPEPQHLSLIPSDVATTSQNNWDVQHLNEQE